MAARAGAAMNEQNRLAFRVAAFLDVEDVRRLHRKLEMVEWLDFGIKRTHGDSAVSLCHDNWGQSKGTE